MRDGVGGKGDDGQAGAGDNAPVGGGGGEPSGAGGEGRQSDGSQPDAGASGNSGATGGRGGAAGSAASGGQGGAAGSASPTIDYTEGTIFGGQDSALAKLESDRNVYAIRKLVAGDAKPGYIELKNGHLVGQPPNRKAVTQYEPVSVTDVASDLLPAEVSKALWGRVDEPGHLNLIFGINPRENTGASGARPWKNFDASGYVGIEFFTRLAFVRNGSEEEASRVLSIVLHEGEGGSASATVVGPVLVKKEWQRARRSFERLNFDLKKLGRIDLQTEIESDNPPIQWWVAGLRFVTQAEWDKTP